MIDPKFFDNMAKQLASFVPSSLHTFPTELEAHFRTTLEALFSKLNLVTREEFDVQVKLLDNARKKIAELEAMIKSYEEKL